MTRAAEVQRDESARLLERLFDDGSALGLTEAQLVERFASGRDESAFATLVGRHGPMVLGVCRRFLRDPNDVDDAFQAVFLVLARKAGGLREKDLLANWLYGVALRVAVRSRATAAQRIVSDPGDRLVSDARKRTALPPAEVLARVEDEAKLHEEVGRLPTRYRAPVVACYFEGRTHEEAAAYLGCPVGTVKGRLARARDLLKRRLARRGVVAPAALVTFALGSPDLRAAVPAAQAIGAVRLAVAVASSPAAWMTTAAVSASARSLSEGVIQAMFYAQLKALAPPASFVAVGLLVAGASFAANQQTADVQSPTNASSPTATVPAHPAASQVQPASPPTTAVRRRGQSANASGEAGVGMMGMAGMGGDMMVPGMMGNASGRGPVPVTMRMARLSAFLAATEPGSEDEAIHATLDQRLTVELGPNATLNDLLGQVRSVKSSNGKPLPVFVSQTGLEDADADLSTPVHLDLKDVPLKSILRLALKDLGLAYCVRDGVLIISSMDDISMELNEVQYDLIGRFPDKYDIGPQGLVQKKEPPAQADHGRGGFQ